MKLISCNIEGDKHFQARLFPFFAKEQADILVLQEVFEVDLEKIKQASGLRNCVFYPQANIILPNIHLPLKGSWGVAIFANEIIEEEGFYYCGHQHGQLAVFKNGHPELIDRVALRAKVKVNEQLFQLVTVHFTWSGDATVTALQQRDYLILRQFLESFEEIIFCGDLNTPRGGEIFDDLAKKYTDNIPLAVETTIDKNLHKSGKDIRLVVDSLFTSKEYVAEEVRVVPNTSDHMAVVAEIERVSS